MHAEETTIDRTYMTNRMESKTLANESCESC